MGKKKKKLNPIIEEAIELTYDIGKAFKGVKGPPKVTLCVARGIDDHQYEDLDKLASKQKHHLHWLDVRPEEIDYFHDTWAFMDAQAFQFYIPAFMNCYLEQIIEKKDIFEIVDTDWLPITLADFGKDKFSLISSEQKLTILKFLEYIHRYTKNEYDKNAFFENNVKPWKKMISTEPQL